MVSPISNNKTEWVCNKVFRLAAAAAVSDEEEYPATPMKKMMMGTADGRCWARKSKFYIIVQQETSWFAFEYSCCYFSLWTRTLFFDHMHLITIARMQFYWVHWSTANHLGLRHLVWDYFDFMIFLRLVESSRLFQPSSLTVLSRLTNVVMPGVHLAQAVSQPKSTRSFPNAISNVYLNPKSILMNGYFTFEWT